MDKAQLQATPEIWDILKSEHFESIQHYLREHVLVLKERLTSPEYLIHNAGKLEGWLACVDHMRDLKVVTQPPGQQGPRQQYQPRP